jgi:hypothetical protein
MTDDVALRSLRADFLATSTTSMPLAGMAIWSVAGLVGLAGSGALAAYAVLFGSGLIFPLALAIDALRGQRRLRSGTAGNPLMVLFLRSIVMIALLWPLAILAARAAQDPTLIVLGGAILMAIIWIPYGWAAGDPAGLEHAIARSVACYAAFVLVPQPYVASAICGAVVLSYLYTLVRMKRPTAVAVA